LGNAYLRFFAAAFFFGAAFFTAFFAFAFAILVVLLRGKNIGYLIATLSKHGGDCNVARPSCY
jgi:hypothetical protein